MADHGQFFSESDPEWAVTRLAAHAVEAQVRPARRVGWPRAVGAVVVVVAAAVAFLAGLRHQPAPLQPQADPKPEAVTRSMAPQTTLSAVSSLPRTPVAAAPRVTPEPTPSTTATPGPAPIGKPTAKQKAPVKQTPKPVGPNQPIATPIDPDDS